MGSQRVVKVGDYYQDLMRQRLLLQEVATLCGGLESEVHFYSGYTELGLD